MKTVLLFGGSFNPPHDGHLITASHVNDVIKPDEIWMMFSVNPLKDPNAYAPMHHRMEMGRLIAQHYPDVPLVPTDIEEKIGAHETWQVLRALRNLFPDHNFIWSMGADNLLHFEQWQNGEEIFNNYPVVILNRPPYTAQALASPTAQKFAHLRKDKAEDLAPRQPGWIFVDSPDVPVSSSELLARMRRGETRFTGGFASVADYILRHPEIYQLPPYRPIPPGPAGP